MDNEKEVNYPLLENNIENRTLFQNNDKCDKYDYLTAVGCGAIGGLIDIFLVGIPEPEKSILGDWTDLQTEKCVMNFAKKMGWNPRQEQENNVKSAIGFLERTFKVNYDQRNSNDVKKAFKMGTQNHHMMSLSHSPDIVGLFFSILNQFTSTSSFISDKGQLITISTNTYELKGNNLISKLFCGVVNWFGHIMSDISGSQGSKGRGSGIVIPFYELFGFCKFGKFNVQKDKQDLGIIATRAFQQGYDFRFGLAQSIPVIITDLLIRFIWAFRRYFQYKKSLKECIPTQKHDDLRIMLLLGNGTLCAMDGIDAGAKSGGNFLVFFMRLNLIAWLRFVTLVLKEVFIRIGIVDALQKDIKAYQRINEALLVYLDELKKIDIELFKKETEEYNKVINLFDSTKTYEELNNILLDIFYSMGLNKPWQGNFDEHMSNKNGTLRFE